ncbi:MAG: hypothetical protein K8R21_00230 [Leptospira sp.]|nr:hypothetical protein [Leptospira sp.]
MPPPNESFNEENINLTNFPAQKDQKTTRELGMLLYRVLNRTDEIQTGGIGGLRIPRDIFIRTFTNQPELFNIEDKNKFIKSIADLFKNTALTNEKLEVFCTKVFNAYHGEIKYLRGKTTQFSFDIIFQVIELLQTESNSPQNESGLITLEDRNNILKHFKAYNELTNLFKTFPNTKLIIDKRDEIIEEFGNKHNYITFVALESMFRNILAQILLSKKHNCNTLIAEWAKEYGFDEETASRIRKYIPVETSIIDFRTKYAQAMKIVKDDMDMMFLRTLSNYFASWVSNVSEQLPV